MLCGLGLPESGQVLWRDVETQIEPGRLHSEMMYLGHALGLKEELSALENLRFFAHMKQRAFDLGNTRSVLATLGLKGREHLPLRVLSQGQKRRVALAKLFVHEAKLWILDEPFVALDAQGLKVLLQAMEQHLQNKGLLVYTSHQRVELHAPGIEVSLKP